MKRRSEMKKTVCDVCGTEINVFSSPRVYVSTLSEKVGVPDLELDLCHEHARECRVVLENWLQDKLTPHTANDKKSDSHED